MKALETYNLYKYYANKEALKNVNFSIPENSICGLLGPNGAGKTSLLRILTRIIYPDSGRVLFHEKLLHKIKSSEIGYLPEERGLYRKMKAGEHLIYLARLKGLSLVFAEKQLRDWFSYFQILNWWDKEIESFSKGMQQKLQFIAAVIHNPWFIILDEPFSGFDPVNMELVRDEIINLKKKGNTVLLSTHRIESVEQLCDYLVLLNNGEIILEGYKDVLINQYKNQIYEISTSERLIESNDYYEIIKTEKRDQVFVSKIALKYKKPDEVLKMLTQQTKVFEYCEQLPSVKDIFFKATETN